MRAEYNFFPEGDDPPDFVQSITSMLASGEIDLLEAMKMAIGTVDPASDATSMFHTAMICYDLDHLRDKFHKVTINPTGTRLGIGISVDRAVDFKTMHIDVKERLVKCLVAVLRAGGVNARASGIKIILDDDELDMDSIVDGFREELNKLDKEPPSDWDRWLG